MFALTGSGRSKPRRAKLLGSILSGLADILDFHQIFKVRMASWVLRTLMDSGSQSGGWVSEIYNSASSRVLTI